MELQGERLIPADVARTWRALNEPTVLKDCVPGCESVERAGEDGFETVLALKVGPVSARFKGKLRLTRIDAPHSYTIVFEGQGGAAGFGNGSADVSLVAEDAGTRLRYAAKAQVGGKLAQIGSRLVDGVAQKIVEEFFARLEASLQAQAAPGAAPLQGPSPSARVPAWIWIAVAIVVAGIAYLGLR